MDLASVDSSKKRGELRVAAVEQIGWVAVDHINLGIVRAR